MVEPLQPESGLRQGDRIGPLARGARRCRRSGESAPAARRPSPPRSACLDLGILVEAPAFSRRIRYVRMQPPAKSHTPSASSVRIRVGVEVAHAVPPRVLEQLHEVERVADALGRRSGSPGRTCPARWALRSMWNSFPCHSVCATAWWNERPDIVSCANSGLRPTISGPLELVDERERVADRREQDVAARLVGLGLEREAQVVAPVARRTRSRGRPPRRSGRARRGRPSPRRPRRPRARPTSRRPSAPSSTPRSIASSVLRSAKRRTAGRWR